jgi:hypothetical protein
VGSPCAKLQVPSPIGSRPANRASVERNDLPHPDAFAQPVEAFVDVVELQPMGQQLVDRQAAGAEEGDHAGHVALGCQTTRHRSL